MKFQFRLTNKKKTHVKLHLSFLYNIHNEISNKCGEMLTIDLLIED